MTIVTFRAPMPCVPPCPQQVATRLDEWRQHFRDDFALESLWEHRDVRKAHDRQRLAALFRVAPKRRIQDQAADFRRSIRGRVQLELRVLEAAIQVDAAALFGRYREPIVGSIGSAVPRYLADKTGSQTETGPN